jgi:hypothetical protein
MQLLLTDYDASGAQLTVQPSAFDSETGELKANFPLWHNGQSTVEGAYAYRREGHFNATIKPQFKTDGTGTAAACYVRFELPKFAGGSNFHALDKSGVMDAIRAAGAALDGFGIKTNIETAQIARLDAFKNAVMSEPVSCFQPVLSLLKGSRMKQRGYEEGFLWENGRQQICFYDKLRKMRHDKLPVAGLPANVLRGELRFLKSNKVRDALSMKSVRDLVENYEEVRRVYQDTMSKQLFRVSTTGSTVMVESALKEEMAFFQERYGREWLDAYFRTFGLHCLLQKASIETVVGVVDELTENRMAKSRMKNKLSKLRFDAEALYPATGSKRTVGELYDELREKIIGDGDV